MERGDPSSVPTGRLAELATHLDAPLLQLLCRLAMAKVDADAADRSYGAGQLEQTGCGRRAVAVARHAERIARAAGDTALARTAAAAARRLAAGTRVGPSGGAPPHPAEPESTGPARSLSRREQCEVAVLAAGGLSDRAIAARLIVSVRTVESHLANAYRKLGIAFQPASWTSPWRADRQRAA